MDAVCLGKGWGSFWCVAQPGHGFLSCESNLSAGRFQARQVPRGVETNMEELEAEKVGGPQMRGVSMWQPSRYHINVRGHML